MHHNGLVKIMFMNKTEILKNQTNSQGAKLTDFISPDGYVWKMIENAMERYAESQKSAIPIVRLLLPDILNGIKTATPELLPKEWIQNEHENGNYMGGFLTGVRWLEENAIKQNNEF